MTDAELVSLNAAARNLDGLADELFAGASLTQALKANDLLNERDELLDRAAHPHTQAAHHSQSPERNTGAMGHSTPRRVPSGRHRDRHRRTGAARGQAAGPP